MSLTTAVNAIEFLYKNLERQRELSNSPKLKGTINFFGGEPLLRYYDIIEPLVLIVEKDYPDCFNFGITTNGVLLDKEKIDFLYEHNIIPLLSMDGDKETQDLLTQTDFTPEHSLKCELVIKANGDYPLIKIADIRNDSVRTCAL